MPSSQMREGSQKQPRRWVIDEATDAIKSDEVGDRELNDS